MTEKREIPEKIDLPLSETSGICSSQIVVVCTSLVMTVDEMFAPFRGRVPFRMYIPSKPAKYGLKIFMVNDAKSQYALNAIPYLGKNSAQETSRPSDVNPGEFYTMKLIQDLLQVGRAVVCDNWLT